MKWMSSGEKDLLAIYRDRLRDLFQAKTRYRRQLERRPRHFKEALEEYFKKEPDTLKKIEENRALSAWEKFVGPTVGRVSKAVRIQNETLVVYVNDPLWLQQLLFLKHDLLRQYQKQYPTLGLKDIYLKRG